MEESESEDDFLKVEEFCLFFFGEIVEGIGGVVVEVEKVVEVVVGIV